MKNEWVFIRFLRSLRRNDKLPAANLINAS